MSPTVSRISTGPQILSPKPKGFKPDKGYTVSRLGGAASVRDMEKAVQGCLPREFRVKGAWDVRTVLKGPGVRV